MGIPCSHQGDFMYVLILTSLIFGSAVSTTSVPSFVSNEACVAAGQVHIATQNKRFSELSSYEVNEDLKRLHQMYFSCSKQ